MMDNTLVMDQAVQPSLLDQVDLRYVGQAIPRVEGALKVSGRIPYVGDQPIPALYGYMVSAKVGKGHIREIYKAAALAVPGVVDVIVDFVHFIRHPQHVNTLDAPITGVDTIDYFGQLVAVVVAESFEAAREGALAVTIDYEQLGQGVYDFQQAAAKPDAMQKGFSDNPQEQNQPLAALAQAPIKIDRHYSTSNQSNSAMELHTTLAYWQDDQVIVHTSMQRLQVCRQQIAATLKLKLKQVRLVSPFVGGGFGGKLGVTQDIIAAILASKQLGRAVKITLTRQQVMEATIRRPQTLQHIALGADTQGQLNTVIHNTISSNLADENVFEPAAQSTHFLYQGAHRQVTYAIARMNQLMGASMRAPGEGSGLLALEAAMDELAETLNLDPVQLRILNLPPQDPSKQRPFSSNHLHEALQRGAEKFAWAQRNKIPASTRQGDWLIGLGMATAVRVNTLKESRARVTLLPEGKAIVASDMTEIGTGAYTMMMQLTADLLGLPLMAIEIRLGDSDLPISAGAGGSFGAASAGSAIYLACQALREQIAKKLNTTPDTIALQQGWVITDNQRLPLNDVLTKPLSAVGKIEPGKTANDYTQASFGAHFAEVAVHYATGEIRVRRLLGTYAAGRILNPLTARSQCLGGMVFALGAALDEALIFDKRSGRLVTNDLANYHIPVNLDVPEMEVLFIEERDPYANPLHIKGLGEISSSVGAAIANAVYNATGIRVYDYPITLDKLLDRLPHV
ncbi:MAG: xanthine dehydrogenase family protein molybdopterin-binding subunit [Candidatus Thiocaldithrix dubininis]|uniref:Xanthine dehydrogenase family protein molybdopterin-binding subunit n=1 Tax=Candidatus Thiocaldithrix dubininis TaxID=3080823 RepID=A0AA95H3H4_9GAMM|nr:MAG: xanthine dehydrogenase family protein molybdopterin-binding subunit [Candidatus Thiocaldithrix dubininis]